MVPNGWKKLSLQELVSINYGKSPKEIIDENGIYDIVGTGGITGSTNSYLHSGPSVIIGRKGTIDKPQFLKKPFWAIDTTFYCLPLDSKKLDMNWFYQLSQVIDWRRYNEASGVPSLSRGTIYSIKVPTPPIQEQQKIVKILTTWDKAIDTTERLIDNSKQQKKALMQQLLTGKQRFDFEKNSYELKQTRYGDIPKDWKYVKIKDIAKQLTKKNSDNNDYPVISCSKHYGFVNSLEYFKKQVFSDNTTGYRIIPRDCFGFPANHIEEGSIGLQTTHDFALVSPIYVVFKANVELINNIYLYALLKTEHYRQIFSASTNASVDRRGSLRWKEFSEIRIPLPPLEEQQKIAAVLTNADKEIELLEQQLADLQQEKKALMQVLLTGKVRVTV